MSSPYDEGSIPCAIAFDPGIGFGKTVAHNLALLAHLDELRIDDRPLVVGVSRKSFLGKIGRLRQWRTANADGGDDFAPARARGEGSAGS